MDTLRLSERSKEKLIIDGFGYVFDKLSTSGTLKFWRCDRRSSCKARVHTDLHNIVVKSLNEHTHDSDPALFQAKMIVSQSKIYALVSNENPINLYSQALASASLSVHGKMPSKDSFRKTIQRTRNIHNRAPVNPQNLNELSIPFEYSRIEVLPDIFENFLLYDSHDNDCRFIIFFRETYSSFISHINHIFIDGTFSLSPPLFSQILVILGKRSGFVLPLFYCLLPNKSNLTYTRVFNKIIELLPDFRPTFASCDFELALINAIASSFVGTRIDGCLFHLSKNFRKSLNENNLLQRYNNDPDFSLHCRMILSIAFVPPEGVISAFEALCNLNYSDVDPIMEWFEDNYIGRLKPDGSRKTPRFSPNIWSVYERVLSNRDRTNNYAEAAHRRLQIQFSCSHPTLWKFIDGLKNCQKITDQIYEEFVRGDVPPRKRTKYLLLDQRILRIVSTYSSRNIIEYLRGLAHNYVME